MKNLVVVSTMLVIGLGGGLLQITASSALSGMSLAAIVGILVITSYSIHYTKLYEGF